MWDIVCRGICLALTLTTVMSGCRRSAMAPSRSSGSEKQGWLYVRHSVKSVTNKNWKAEVWLHGTDYGVIDPVGVAVRLTPKEPGQRAAPIGALAIQLKSIAKDATTRRVRLQASFEDCTKMRERREA